MNLPFISNNKNSKVIPLVNNNPITFKLITIGDIGVGKTCIVKRYVDGNHIYDYTSTIGVDFLSKCIEIDKKEYKLNIWDTTGQERFQSITNSFYRDTHCVLLVFDLNDLQSFTSLKYFMDRIKKCCRETTPVFLIGNKCDLVHNVKLSDINLFITENNIKGYVSTSSKNNTGINDIFNMVLDYLIKNHEPLKMTGLQLEVSKVTSTRNCCIVQ
jgi:small GTP-binding protein